MFTKGLWIAYATILISSNANASDYEKTINDLTTKLMETEQRIAKRDQHIATLDAKEKELIAKIEKMRKDKKERREKAERELANWKTEAQRNAESMAKQTQEFFNSWNECLSRETKLYDEWMISKRKIWVNVFEVENAKYWKGLVSYNQRVRDADQLKHSLNNLAKQEGLRVKKIKNQFEQMVQQKIELSAEKVRAIVIRIQQDNSSWTKEQKTFWECEQKLQENQLVILTTFKTSSLSRFLEQESLWQKVYFNWT